jgi:5-methyltetrahydrofolate--homocysteine methyltransferase
VIELKKPGAAIINGDVPQTVKETQAALRNKIPAKVILDKGLLPGIEFVGEQFAKGQTYFPELVMAGEAMTCAMEILAPELSSKKVPQAGKFLIGTVKDDIHDIGKNIVVMFLRANGWNVVDLGTDVPPERFRDEVQKEDYDILGLSALLTITMPMIDKTIDILKKAGLRDKIKIMIGGATVDQIFCDRVGADAYGADAVDATKKAKKLIEKSE